MTTSLVTTTGTTERDIIEGAIRIVTSDDTVDPNQYLYARKALNQYLKTMQVHYGLWLKQEVTLFTAPGQTEYNFPGANGSVSVVDTLSAASLDDATPTDEVIVSSTTGMTAGDYFGIVDDSGELQWGVIETVNSSIKVTLAATLSINATAPCQVWSYTSGLYRPTRVFQALRRNNDGYDVPLALYSRDEYQALPNKGVTGVPVGVFYDPQTVTGIVKVWPAPADSDNRIILTIDRQLQINTSPEQTLDIPEEWLEAVRYGLAYRLCFEYGVTRANAQFIQEEYQLLMDAVLNNSRDYASTYFGVGRY